MEVYKEESYMFIWNYMGESYILLWNYMGGVKHLIMEMLRWRDMFYCGNL